MEKYVRNEDLSVTITFTEEEFENLFCFCADCGELMFIDYAVRLNGEYFCDECLTTCDCCGTVIRKKRCLYSLRCRRLQLLQSIDIHLLY